MTTLLIILAFCAIPYANEAIDNYRDYQTIGHEEVYQYTFMRGIWFDKGRQSRAFYKCLK